MHKSLRDDVVLRGHVSIGIYGQASGSLLKTIEQDNLITQGGRSLIAAWMSGGVEAAPSHIALGSGSTPPQVSDVALESEVYRQVITDRQNVTVQVIYKLFISTGSANGQTIREVGLFNAPAAGFMFARAVLSQPIVKSTAITLTVAWTIDIG
jgi:hypothetical protein